MLYRFVANGLLLFFLTLSCFHSVAQADRKLDSLLSLLKVQNKDTGKVHLLNALSRQSLRMNKIPDAKKYAADALFLAKELGFDRGVMLSYSASAAIYTQMGHVSTGQGNYPGALENYLKALKIAEKAKSKPGMANSYSMVGRVYWIQKNYSTATDYHTKALALYEELKDKNGIATIYNNIGLVHENQGRFEEALKYYYDAIKMYGETGNKWAMIDRYFNIGFLYEDQKNYPEALKSHLEALKLSEEIGTKHGIAASNSNMGGVYSLQENYLEALKRYLLALKLYREIANEEGVAISHNNIGGMYIELKDYPMAKQHLDSALFLSNKLGIAGNATTSYDLLARLDSTTGNWEDALRNHKSYIVFRDSLASNETTNKIAKVQMQYDFDKKEEALKYQHLLTGEKLKQQTLLTNQQEQILLLKEQDLALVTNEKKLQQLQIEKDRAIYAEQRTEAAKKENQLLLLNKEKALQDLELNKQRIQKYYLIALLALFAILSFFIYRSFRTRQQLKLQTLRNKIASDLHDDVGSTLSSISIFSQMAQQGSKEIMPLLDTIGDSSRKMLDAMADIVWTINPENDQFEKIILRMKNFAYELLGAKNIDFEFITDEEITRMNLPMDVRKNLYLVFKEATNNMVKYSGASKAMFSIKTEKNNLAMSISDNGKGFNANQPSEGNGLRNMKKRAEEIGAELSIETYPGGGTRIDLKLAV